MKYGLFFKRMKKKQLACIVFIIVVNQLFGQDLVTVSGTYTLLVSSSKMSMEAAEKEAINRAKIEALNEAFGEALISENNLLESEIKSGDKNQNSEIFNSVLNTLVRGDWIEDIKPPKVERILKKDKFYIKATVKGKAREIVAAQVDFSAIPLRCPDLNCRGDNFMNKDQLYLHFDSPASGYLAVYLQEKDTVYCLLPYPSDSDGKFKIEANKSYILFSREHPYDSCQTKEYALFSNDEDPLTLYIHVVYSTKGFFKSEDNQSDTKIHKKYNVPRQLWLKDFNHWLARNRTKDSQMQRKIIPITITQ